MTLPEEEVCFFCWAVQQLAPAVRQEFVDRVAQTLGAHRDPGPGDFDRAIREGILGLWIPPAIEEVRGTSRWHRSAASTPTAANLPIAFPNAFLGRRLLKKPL